MARAGEGERGEAGMRSELYTCGKAMGAGCRLGVVARREAGAREHGCIALPIGWVLGLGARATGWKH